MVAGDWEKCYMCIDLKSFYASVECADRGLDPFSKNLVMDLQRLVKQFLQGQSCVPELHRAHAAQRRMHPLLVVPPNV